MDVSNANHAILLIAGPNDPFARLNVHAGNFALERAEVELSGFAIIKVETSPVELGDAVI